MISYTFVEEIKPAYNMLQNFSYSHFYMPSMSWFLYIHFIIKSFFK